MSEQVEQYGENYNGDDITILGFGDDEGLVLEGENDEDAAAFAAFVDMIQRAAQQSQQVGALCFLMQLVAAGVDSDAVKEDKKEEAMTAAMEAFSAIGVSRELWETAVTHLRAEFDSQDEYRSGPGDEDDFLSDLGA